MIFPEAARSMRPPCFYNKIPIPPLKSAIAWGFLDWSFSLFTFPVWGQRSLFMYNFNNCDLCLVKINGKRSRIFIAPARQKKRVRAYLIAVPANLLAGTAIIPLYYVISRTVQYIEVLFRISQTLFKGLAYPNRPGPAFLPRWQTPVNGYKFSILHTQWKSKNLPCLSAMSMN